MNMKIAVLAFFGAVVGAREASTESMVDIKDEPGLRGAADERKLQSSYCSWSGNCPANGGDPNASWCNASSENCINGCGGSTYCSGASSSASETYCSWGGNCPANGGDPNASWCNESDMNCRHHCGGRIFCLDAGGPAPARVFAYCGSIGIFEDRETCGPVREAFEDGEWRCGWSGPPGQDIPPTSYRNGGYYRCPARLPNCSEHGYCGRFGTGFQDNCRTEYNYMSLGGSRGSSCWTREP